MTLHMPEEFKGKCTPREGTCGICLKRYGFRSGRKVEQNRKALRDMGWTFRTDLGWVCPCRHGCELAAGNEPKPKPTRSRSRRYQRPTKRVRAIIRRRNRQGIE